MSSHISSVLFLFPTVPTWMFTIIIFLLCLTVVGFLFAIAVIVYVYKDKKGTKYIHVENALLFHIGSMHTSM